MTKCATFDADPIYDSSEDETEDEYGTFAVPPGRILLEGLCTELARKGHEIGQPKQDGLEGWENSIRVEGHAVHLSLLAMDPWLLRVSLRVPRLTMPWRRRALMRRVVTSVDAGLRAGVLGIRWLDWGD